MIAFMDPNDDPFPPSLPRFKSSTEMGAFPPEYIDQARSLDHPLHSTYSRDPDLSFDSLDPIYISHDLSGSPNFQPQKHCKERDGQQRGNMVGTIQPKFFTSPISSPLDSSSDSSARRQSETSSDSSGSAMQGGDGPALDDCRPSRDAPETILEMGISDEMSDVNLSSASALDLRDLDMEKMFNFPSASSNSNLYANSNTAVLSPRNMKVPFRPSSGHRPMAKRRRGHRPGASEGSHGSSPLSCVTKSPQDWQMNSSHTHSTTSSWPRCQSNGTIFDRPNQSPFLVNGCEGPVSTFNPRANHIPVASPIVTPSEIHTDPLTTRILVDPINSKSRVETQIPVRLTMYPMPQGIRRLHLPPHTVSKPKQLARPTPAKSPDMLELSCELVCSSPMEDERKRMVAFARAATETITSDSPTSSFDNGSYEKIREQKPSDGGRVMICSTCITREEKRASRKKSKNDDEDEAWQQYATNRVILFNSYEVKEWQRPSETRLSRTTADPRMNDRDYYNNIISDAPPGAMQIDLPMRIACYCRHQEEKKGFQVIFTIKDHRGICITQTITNSITITDDHKTSIMPIAAGQQNTVYTENMHLPGLGVFPREPPKQNPTGPIRQAQSLTDLQTLQQNYNRQMISQPQPLGYTHTTSQQIPATMTPRTLSRQVSISADSGPYQKRRKASGSKKISNDLVMTKLATSEPPTIPASNSVPADQLYSSKSTVTSPSPIAFFPSNFSSGQIQSGPTSTMSTQYDTNSSTSAHNDSTFSAAVPKSQSMENLDVDLQWPGSPSSNALSEPYNSTSGLPQLNTHGPGNLFGVTFPGNTLHRALSSHHVQVGSPLENEAPADYPIITKTIPREGPMSGGIEVTCIGTGFYEGLSVLFGNAIATTISVLGDTCLVCFLPPATRDGVVSVRCNHDYRGITLLQPLRQVYFTYVDDDDLQLLKLALVTLNHRLTGRTEDAGDIARKTMNNSHSGIASHTGIAGQAREQYRQACQPNSALMTMEDLESSLLGCLDIIDLDDSPNQPRLNRRRPNGQSMLHFSASLGFYRFVAALLARGANPDLRDKNGMSPMHMAALHNHSRIVRKLRSAGGDPMLRSLRGFTPADMASTTEVRDVINILENFSVSGIIGESPISRRSRTSSVTSFQPLWGGFSNSASMNSEAELPYDIVAVNSKQADATESSPSHVASPAQAWARSRRNSDVIEKPYVNSHSPGHQARNDGLLAAATAWSAWRDQLVSQVQILQQSVHRTLPTLPMPTLPPIPNLPYYQAYPMVRRISSLVPQRYPRTFARDSKYNDYHWWELIKGTTAPPAYEELYPDQGQGETATTKGSIKTTEGEAELIAEGSTASDRAALNASLVLDRAEISTKVLTPQQREDLMAAHAMKVKRLRSDRNLFFFWIPLLILVMVAMLKDQVVQLWQFGKLVIPFFHRLSQQYPVATE